VYAVCSYTEEPGLHFIYLTTSSYELCRPTLRWPNIAWLCLQVIVELYDAVASSAKNKKTMLSQGVLMLEISACFRTSAAQLKFFFLCRLLGTGNTMQFKPVWENYSAELLVHEICMFLYGRYFSNYNSHSDNWGKPTIGDVMREREREGLFSTIQQNICRTKWQQQNKVEGCRKGTRPIIAGHPLQKI